MAFLSAVRRRGDRVFLVWSGAEGGKMLLATNLLGEVQWGKNFTSTWGLSAVAVDGGAVYVHDGKRLSRVAAANGSYLPWEGEVDIALATLLPDSNKETKSQGLAAKAGKVYLSYTKENTVLVLDAKTGKLQKTLQIESPDGLLRRERPRCSTSSPAAKRCWRSIRRAAKRNL